MPDFTSLVAELPAGEQVIYVTAEVLHCLSVRLYRSGSVVPVNGEGPPQGRAPKSMVLVGCQFTGRLAKLPDD
ncbi:MAG TPA: hypothetical protein EYP56_18435 [Planctomycetaceae bacterium]|nr:hypothetical protein [Planctomycetaceae bacterium]